MIYYVEDDDSIRELVVYTLNQMGMETRGFTCGDEFWPAMEKKLPDFTDVSALTAPQLEQLFRATIYMNTGTAVSDSSASMASRADFRTVMA